MTHNSFILAVEALGGKVETHRFDDGYNLLVIVRHQDGRKFILRASSHWGDVPAEVRIERMLAERGIILGEDNPYVSTHDPITV